MSTVTCHTAGCPSNGRPVEIDLTYPDPDTGEIHTVDGVSCGACGQPIEDVDNGEPEPEPEPPRLDNELPPVVDNELPPVE